MSAKLSAREVLDRSIVVLLPLPDKRLSPNYRQHWSGRQRAVREARELAAWTVRRDWGTPELPPGRLPITITWTLPDNRRRDDDNLVASLKAYRDGIADALGIDDSRFDIVKLTRTVVKGKGSVTIEVST